MSATTGPTQTAGLTQTTGLTQIAETTRARVLESALHLFAIHTFAGTSLQMIADTVGITKAAVYHHFKTRDDILSSVIEPAARELMAVIRAAEDRRSPSAQADAMLTGFIDVTMQHRALVALICTDVSVIHAVSSHLDIGQLTSRILRLFTAHQHPPESEVNGLLALTGMACTAASPLLAHLSNEDIHEHLLDAGRRILGLRRRVH